VRYEKGPQHYNSSTADPEWTRHLDMTVCCRSNDLIWGAHGANAVHFSVLQEYVAARVGCEVGTMYQLSNNYHAYTAFISVLEKRAESGYSLSVRLMDNRYDERDSARSKKMVTTEPMFNRPDYIDEDVKMFWRWFTEYNQETESPHYKNDWFATTLEMMMMAHYFHKKGARAEAMHCAREVDAHDWSVAAVEWLERRNKEKTGDKRPDDAVQGAGAASEEVSHVADAASTDGG
jgi:hypothetical protein